MTRQSNPKHASDASLEATAKQIGEALDRAAHSLALWRHDRATALYYLLTVFEDAIRFRLVTTLHVRGLDAPIPMDVSRLNYEFGLSRLVRIAYQRCPPPRSSPLGVPFNWETYGQAWQALDFGSDYEGVVGSLESALNGRQRMTVRGKNVYFSCSPNEAVDDAAVAFFTAVANKRAEQPHPFSVLSFLASPSAPALSALMQPAMVPVDDTRISYRVPPPVDAFFTDLANQATSFTDLSPSTQVLDYTIDDFRTLFRYVYKRAAENQVFCWMSTAAGVRGHGVGNIVFPLTAAELTSQFVAPGCLAPDCLNAIVRDLTYDASMKHTDIFFQPLVEIAPGEFLVSPSVVTGSQWERNLLKLWSNKCPDRYAAVVGLAKNKLATSIAAVFAQLGFPTATNRRLQLPGASTLTDVDVAVFEPMTQALVLAEVKWLTEPADPREVRRADAELAKGIKQVREAVAFVRQHPTVAEGLLFPSGTLKFTEALRIRALVIGRGHFGSSHIADPQIPIMDYGMVAGITAASDGTRGLEDILDVVVAQMREPQRGRDYQSSSVAFPLGGYRFHIPAFRPRLLPAQAPSSSGAGVPKAGRNDQCPCGCGFKYKSCHGR